MARRRLRSRRCVLSANLIALMLLLTSCGLPFGGGFLGALLLVGALLAGALSVTSLSAGCGSRATPSADSRLQVCLTPILHDGGVDTRFDARFDMPITSCFGADAWVGPCLAPMPPDAALDTALNTAPDTTVRVCLSDIPLDGGQASLDHASAAAREAAIARLETARAISAELAQRLRRLLG